MVTAELELAESAACVWVQVHVVVVAATVVQARVPVLFVFGWAYAAVPWQILSLLVTLLLFRVSVVLFLFLAGAPAACDMGVAGILHSCSLIQKQVPVVADTLRGSFQAAVSAAAWPAFACPL